MPLGDALALTLLLRTGSHSSTTPPRWDASRPLEAREVGLADAQVLIGARVSIGERAARAGAAALQALVEAHGRDELAGAVGRWLKRGGG